MNADPPAGARAAAQSMVVDLATSEVVTALGHAGIPSILLKGPALARWLYDRSEVRTYADCDLLIPPGQVEAAQGVLAGLGFGLLGLEAIPGDWPKHARNWTRADAVVDLHTTLVGVEAEPTTLWDVLWRETEPMRVGGVEVQVLRPGARAMMVALHAAKDGPRVAKVRHDLGHAVERLPESVWREASAVARRLRAEATLAAGLRLNPEGAALAERLGLPHDTPIAVAIRSGGGAPPLATGIDWLLTSPGWRGKATLIARKLVPPRAFMEAWTPVARKGRLGLVAAYAWRPLWVLWHAGPAFSAWLRARRAATRRDSGTSG